MKCLNGMTPVEKASVSFARPIQNFERHAVRWSDAFCESCLSSARTFKLLQAYVRFLSTSCPSLSETTGALSGSISFIVSDLQQALQTLCDIESHIRIGLVFGNWPLLDAIHKRSTQRYPVVTPRVRRSCTYSRSGRVVTADVQHHDLRLEHGQGSSHTRAFFISWK